MSVELHGHLEPTTSTDSSTPLLVLGPSIGTTAAGWDAVVPLLIDRYRVLRFDLPGHGHSPRIHQPVQMSDLAHAVVALVDSVGGGRFAYAGISLGGAIGIELATSDRADRLTGLALICTDARIGEPDGWRARADQVRRQGTPALVDASSSRWFAASFPARNPAAVSRTLHQLMDTDDESYALLAEALGTFDRRGDTSDIAVPTVVIAGETDPVVTLDHAAALAAGIPNARSITLPGTGHQAHIERPAEIADAIGALAPSTRYDSGLATRRAVLGAAHVDRAIAGTTPETADFQRYITETAWGSIWTRPGLDRRTRSVITLSCLVAGHYWDELEMHVRAARTNGLTRAEISEVFLQTAVYAGVPAANSAFAIAKRVFSAEKE